ncbi:MAG: hypothetical protein KH264_05880 [Actinomyces graevenitzii]|nr:hypothetical protein [Actinomyces graevenitzii]
MTRVLELSAQAAGGVRAHIRQVSQLLAKDGHQVLLALVTSSRRPPTLWVVLACALTKSILVPALQVLT